MVSSRLVLSLSIGMLLGSFAGAADLPTPTHYALQYRLYPEEGRLEADARIRITNETAASFEQIPFLLYRLLDVSEARGGENQPLAYTSQIVKDADTPDLQVNLVQVTLARPLAPGAETEIRLRFVGPVHGYPEVWAYVRESISEDYTLLRDDSFAYPVLALPTAASRHTERRFTYDLEVDAPTTHVVATGGRLIGRRQAGDRTIWEWRSKVPVWRLDVALARFVVRENEAKGFKVYVLPGHEGGAERVLRAMQDTVDLYTRLFGPAGDFQGYTAIEIPAGWGSQAADLYFLQTAPAFEDPERLREVYHEVAHNWNALSEGAVQRCRYFDEAFASYFQALALRELRGQESYVSDLERVRASFRRRASQHPLALDTPISDYGEHEIGGFSYTKGAWSLYVLHELVGEREFRSIVRRLLADFGSEPADFVAFRRLAEQVSQRDLSRFFDEWIFGTESSRLMVGDDSIEQIVDRYR